MNNNGDFYHDAFAPAGYYYARLFHSDYYSVAIFREDKDCKFSRKKSVFSPFVFISVFTTTLSLTSHSDLILYPLSVWKVEIQEKDR